MFGRFLDFLFPLECIGCGAVGRHACSACLRRLRLAPRFWRLPELRVSAAFAYADPFVRQLLHDYKYEHWRCVEPALSMLAKRWTVKIGTGYCPPDTIAVPVPLHAGRLRERGFNQAETLARAVARPLGFTVRTNWIMRSRRTKPQAKTGHLAGNVEGAFLARLPSSARGATILLVDDVWTTGATMRQCAQALLAAGAGRVLGFALAWGSGQIDGKQES